MNKNPEEFAIEYLIRNGFKLEEDYNNFARQVVEIAIAAIEKQIPAKLIDRSGWYSGHYLCPTCNKIYWKDEIVPNYCQGCGQKFLEIC